MASSAPIILILGAGANIGHHVARAFAAKGYRVASAARKLKNEDSTPTQLNIQSDFADPDAVAGAFAQTKAAMGLPSVVVYNAASATFGDGADPLALPAADFARSLAVNTTSAFVAAQEAVRAFRQLPESAARTFIYTGNILNTVTMGPLLDLGVGKSATAHVIESASIAYRDRGFKFYYVDERKPDGSGAFNIDGEAHAELFARLAEGASQGPWQQTFVNGVGYKALPARA